MDGKIWGIDSVIDGKQFILKMGTRKSLLALAQSSQIAREIEAKTPGLRIETVGFETQGDRIQNIPLRFAEGKGFFTGELDEALAQGLVDFNVHSLKDLSLERPAGFAPLVLPPRSFGHDVLVFHKRARLKHREGQPLRLGSSAPRRLVHVPAFLATYGPQWEGRGLEIQWQEIRGNVNTRLKRLTDEGDRQLDGVVLALAGLHRLFKSEPSTVSQLLSETFFMVLPLSRCPSAPGQGALALEARVGDEKTLEVLRRVHCQTTEMSVKMERSVLAHYGGGCHLPLAVSARLLPGVGWELRQSGMEGQQRSSERGSHEAQVCLVDGKSDGLLPGVSWKWDSGANPVAARLFHGKREGQRWKWISLRSDDFFAMEDVSTSSVSPDKNRVLYVLSHSRAGRSFDESELRDVNALVWTAGLKSWKAMAEKGHWVQGCHDGWGESQSVELLNALQLLWPWSRAENWTHSKAEQSWQDSGEETGFSFPYERRGVYALLTDSQKSAKTIERLMEIWKTGVRQSGYDGQVLFISSGHTFLELLDGFSLYRDGVSDLNAGARGLQKLLDDQGVILACGPGQTLRVLQKWGFHPAVFAEEQQVRDELLRSGCHLEV